MKKNLSMGGQKEMECLRPKTIAITKTLIY